MDLKLIEPFEDLSYIHYLLDCEKTGHKPLTEDQFKEKLKKYEVGKIKYDEKSGQYFTNRFILPENEKEEVIEKLLDYAELKNLLGDSLGKKDLKSIICDFKEYLVKTLIKSN